jgi:23S rRNA (pseudouridine1915-N3)-methyltransferase
MRLKLVAAGTRLPSWIDAGYQEYARRLAGDAPLELIEIGVTRGAAQGSRERAMQKEGERMLDAIPRGAWVVALDVTGRSIDTPALSRWWATRQRDGRDVVFLIGGPDGLAAPVLERADERMSLSALTFPHGVVRILLAEQLYRALSLLKGHPYHRE